MRFVKRLLERFRNLPRAKKAVILIPIGVVVIAAVVLLIAMRDDSVVEIACDNAGTEGLVFARRYQVYEVEVEEEYEEVIVIFYEVVGFRGSSRAVVIPASHNGYPVARIGNRAFEDNRLTSITIPNICTFTQNT